MAWRATNALRQDLTLHCLKLDLSYHKAHTAGELISRIDGDVNTLSNFFSQLIIQMVGNTILLTSILVLLALEDWRLGLSMLAFSAVALRVLIWIRALAIPHWKTVRKQMAEFYGFVGEQFAGMEDIRANGAGGYALHRFLNLVRERFKPSGGQAQRTAAARMFVREPELLVFDDLSSALDVETERLLWHGSLSKETIRRPAWSSRMAAPCCAAPTASWSSKTAASMPKALWKNCSNQTKKCNTSGIKRARRHISHPPPKSQHRSSGILANACVRRMGAFQKTWNALT